MKKSVIVYASLIIAAISFASPCYANYIFRPFPRDLSDLPHEKYFTWGINFVPPANEVIVNAELKFTNIWDWSTEKNDRLFIHLLDNPKSGVHSYTDNHGEDNFSGQGIFIDSWTDPVGGLPRNFNLVYDFREMGLLNDLKSYIATAPTGNHANFGFAFDPDCHFFNDDVTFTIFTNPLMNPVPEPATMAILGLGALLLGRKK